MNPTQIDILKSDIQHACTLLQTSSLESHTSWILLTQDIIRKIDVIEDDIPLVKKELEELAVLLLLRATTNLQSVQFFGIYPTTRELLKRMINMNLSEIIRRGVSEFILASEQHNIEEQREKELESVKLQVSSLQKEVTQYQDKEYEHQMTQTSPIIDSYAPINEYYTTENSYSMENIKMEEDCIKKEEDDSAIHINISSCRIASEVIKSEINADIQSFCTWNYKLLQKKKCCFCILDFEGNFIMIDKQAERVFGVQYDTLLAKNLFDLIIPFSLFHLKKSMGESIFSSINEQEKIFSYTVYSNFAFEKYKKVVSKMPRAKESVRKKISEQKFEDDEKLFCSDDKGVYYKYLQTLTSRATLINFQFNKLEDLIKLQVYEDVKFNFDHRVFRGILDDNSQKSCPAVLLVTRKAYHMQNFQYSLMEEFDYNIIQMEEKIERSLMKNRKTISKPEENFDDLDMSE